MNPWDLIGWLILVVLTTIVAILIALGAAFLIGVTILALRHLVLHRRDRLTIPRRGQIWSCGKTTAYVTGVTSIGEVTYQVGDPRSLADTLKQALAVLARPTTVAPDAWRAFVDREVLRLAGRWTDD